MRSGFVLGLLGRLYKAATQAAFNRLKEPNLQDPTDSLHIC